MPFSGAARWGWLMFPCLAGIALALVEQAGPRELGQGASIAAPISNHVPKPAHSPTAQEEEEQRTAYTFKSGRTV